eukprot:763431-Hanusia_phi.AAC.2
MQARAARREAGLTLGRWRLALTQFESVLEFVDDSLRVRAKRVLDVFFSEWVKLLDLKSPDTMSGQDSGILVHFRIATERSTLSASGLFWDLYTSR